MRVQLAMPAKHLLAALESFRGSRPRSFQHQTASVYREHECGLVLSLIEPKESKIAIVAAPEPTTREMGAGTSWPLGTAAAILQKHSRGGGGVVM